MWYLYAFDEEKNPVVVHHKTRIIRNDGCVEWVGALHEDFKENRRLDRKHIEGIEVLHLNNSEHAKEAAVRNEEIARRQVDDLPDDPRSYWNYGNSLVGVGKFRESLEVFQKFLDTSQSEEERYIVHLRIAEVHLALGDKLRAIDEARYAVGLRPSYPDAYHLAGQIYYDMEQYEKAKEMYVIGLTKKAPYYSIVVFNPRNYDYHPMMALAKVYFAQNMPIQALELIKSCQKIYPKSDQLKGLIKSMEKEADKMERVLKHIPKLKKINDNEKLLKALDKIPDELQDHPAICRIRNLNFVKETSSGRDLVIVCGYTNEEWNPESVAKKGIGGSEEAVIHLSELLVRRGWNVTVYNNCGHRGKKYGDVWYRPFWSYNFRDKQDVVILWRTTGALKYEINCSNVFVDLHDVVQSGEFTEERLKKIKKVFVKSRFHRSLFPNVPDEKVVVIPNGIDSRVFDTCFCNLTDRGPSVQPDTSIKCVTCGKGIIDRDPYLLVNTSSPDRSLNVLLDLFVEVKKQVPQAKLKWCYGWKVFDVDTGDQPAKIKWKEQVIQKMKETEGCEDLGRINHKDIAKLYLQANVFAYPSEFAEIDCISLTKAMAAGAIPVTTDFSALGEKQRGGVFIHSEKTVDTWCRPGQFDFGMEGEEKKKQWVGEVVRLLQSPPSEKEREKMRMRAQETFSWERIADRWDEILCESVKS